MKWFEYEELMQKAAKNLGMEIDKDGFLIHRYRSEEAAQRLYNDEYNRLVVEEALKKKK